MGRAARRVSRKSAVSDDALIRSTAGREVVAALERLGNGTIASHSRGFFKTGKGEYGEGDDFLGLRVPVIRGEVRRAKPSLDLAVELLGSKWHEVRYFAVVALVELYPKSPDEVFDAYLAHRERVNSWDLVDASAPRVVGKHLLERDRQLLYELADSASLWDRRIAVIATLTFIRNEDFDDALALCAKLLADEQDLIHKATGWMLREIGKRDPIPLHTFLDAHCTTMPRTMLRYAIEHLPKPTRKAYLSGEPPASA